MFSCFRVFSRRKFLGGGGLTKDTGRKKSKQIQATSFQIGPTVSRHKDTVAEGACARTLLHDSDGANFGGRVFVFSFLGVFEGFHVASFLGAKV